MLRSGPGRVLVGAMLVASVATGCGQVPVTADPVTSVAPTPSVSVSSPAPVQSSTASSALSPIASPTGPAGPKTKPTPRPTTSPKASSSPEPSPPPSSTPRRASAPTPRPSAKAKPSRSKRARVVYLTFDDGPSAYTRQVLHILQRYGAKATFFVIGANVRNRASLIRAEKAAGMSVQNHTWNHPDLRTRSNGQIRSEIRRTDAAIRAAGGGRTSCVRPPYGASNRRVRAILSDLGKRQLLWTVDTVDWSRPGSKAIYRRVVNAVEPGSIVLSHDGGGIRTQTVAALPRILATLRARGYRFGTLCH